MYFVSRFTLAVDDADALCFAACGVLQIQIRSRHFAGFLCQASAATTAAAAAATATATATATAAP